MMCADGEDTFSKASHRAQDLRSKKKTELLTRARSKLRTTSTHHDEELKREEPSDVMDLKIPEGKSSTNTTDNATPGI